jgi:hypothetical protein
MEAFLMSSRILYRELAILAGLALAIPLYAKPQKPLRKSIELYSPARVGNTTLLAGQYELIVDDKIATFDKDNKVVAKIPYQLIRIAKSPEDEMVFDKGGDLTEIDFSGKSLAIEFTDDSASVSPPHSALGNR